MATALADHITGTWHTLSHSCLITGEPCRYIMFMLSPTTKEALFVYNEVFDSVQGDGLMKDKQATLSTLESMYRRCSPPVPK